MISRPDIDFDGLAFATWQALCRALSDHVHHITKCRIGTEGWKHFHVAQRTDDVTPETLRMAVDAVAAVLASNVRDLSLKCADLEIPVGIDDVLRFTNTRLSLRVVHVYSPGYVSEDDPALVVPEMWVLRFDIAGLKST